jgi:Holliday junction DNA helicase RuvA
MISYLKGKLLIKNETNCTVLISENCLGLLININSTLIKNNKVGDIIELHIKTIVKENDISLYGFINQEQLNLFEHLLNVNGVGPKAAMNIISNIESEQLISDILSEKSESLAKVKGLGKKTAEKIVFSLKDKFKKEYSALNKTTSDDKIDLVIQALLALGYDNKSILNVVNTTYNNNISIQENIKLVLKEIKK